MDKKRRQHFDDRNAADVELYLFYEKAVLYQAIAALRHHIDKKDPGDISRREPENVGRVADRQVPESLLKHVPEDQDRDERHNEGPHDPEKRICVTGPYVIFRKLNNGIQSVFSPAEIKKKTALNIRFIPGYRRLLLIKTLNKTI